MDRIRFAHSGHRSPPQEVVHDLTLHIPGGECVGILGREGSGKTTVINLLGGLIPPGSGTVLIDGVDPWSDPVSGASLRRRMGFTFQFPEEQYIRETVADEFQEVLAVRRVSHAEARPRMDESLRAAGLDPDAIRARSPFTLSLGESRRVALALALAVRPDALIMDEPTAGLDAGGVSCTVKAIAGLSARGVTVIVATHDVDLIAETATRVLILDEGAIAADGKAEGILTDDETLAKYGYEVPEVVSVAGQLMRAGRLKGGIVLRRADLLAGLGSPE